MGAEEAGANALVALAATAGGEGMGPRVAVAGADAGEGAGGSVAAVEPNDDGPRWPTGAMPMPDCGAKACSGAVACGGSKGVSWRVGGWLGGWVAGWCPACLHMPAFSCL